MAEPADIIDIATQRLRRNAALSHRKAPTVQRNVNWLDFTTSNVCEMFLAELPRRPRLVNGGEIWFTTTALHGTGHYLASEHFLNWNPFKQEIGRPRISRDDLKLTVFDRDRRRTPTCGILHAV